MNKILKILFLCSIFIGCATTPLILQEQKVPPILGAMPNGNILLPTGWTLTPTGTSIPLTGFPIDIAISPDNINAVITNAGYGQQTVSVVNLKKHLVVQTLNIKKTFTGISFSSLGDYFFVSGGNDNTLYRYGCEKDSAWFINSITLGQPAPAEYISATGIAINSEGSIMYAVSRLSNSAYKINAYENKILKSVSFDFPLYNCLLDEQRGLLYVTVWGDGHVALVDIKSFEIKKRIATGNHPTELVMNSDGSLLYVANANDNTISIIDLVSQEILQNINVAPKFNTLPGSTPNALALSLDERTLYVALADNNALAVVDVSQKGKSTVKGFIPTGWYPTAVRCVDSTIVVVNGKGEISGANKNNEHVAEILNGTLSFIPEPNESQLRNFTEQVMKNFPSVSTNNEQAKKGNIFSTDTASPIKFVFLIVKENRTYDDIFGDLKKGRGDSLLAQYGKTVTPNHHALAEEFVLFDNFYSSGSVSADGIQWLLGGYANDYTQKVWHTVMSRRGGDYDFEKQGMASPPSGYIWDAMLKHGIRFRNYGMFLDEDESERGNILPLSNSIAPYTSKTYRGWDIQTFDTTRAAAWQKEFDQFEKDGSLPQFNLLRLPNDHTSGRIAGRKSRKAMVADNDLAVGQIVERISKSTYWKSSAIFIVESNSQGGADHIDAHRSVLLVASPYAKRHFIDSTQYSSLSVLKSIQTIFHLPALTQHDASATPLFNAFSTTPDTGSFTAQRPTVNLFELNR